MRIKVWEKDDYFWAYDKRIDMDPTVVDLGLDIELPVAWNFNWGEKPLGHVTDLRVEDGEITGELTMTHETLTKEDIDDLDMRFGGYYKDVVYTDETETRVKSCKLVSVSTIFNPGYPKVLIEDIPHDRNDGA